MLKRVAPPRLPEESVVRLASVAVLPTMPLNTSSPGELTVSARGATPSPSTVELNTMFPPSPAVLRLVSTVSAPKITAALYTCPPAVVRLPPLSRMLPPAPPPFGCTESRPVRLIGPPKVTCAPPRSKLVTLTDEAKLRFPLPARTYRLSPPLLLIPVGEPKTIAPPPANTPLASGNPAALTSTVFVTRLTTPS